MLAIVFGNYVSVGAKPEAGLIGPLASTTTYYVSTTGSDTNPGTSTAPFRTINKGIAAMAAGDTLLIYGGVYSEQVTISKTGSSSALFTVKAVSGQRVIVDGGLVRDRGVMLSGNYIVVDGLEVQRALQFCVDVIGTNITVRNFTIHDCQRAGLRAKNRNITVEGSTLYNNVLTNAGGTATSGWAATLRVFLGGENVTIRNNTVYNNWGEGIAIGQGKNVNILNNTVHDNFSQNIYINNSMDVNAENNFVYSTNPAYYRSGQPANGISLAEEYFSDTWGAQLARIRVVNNIVAFCRRGIGYTYSEVAGGLDSSTIAFNTIWGATEMGVVVINQPTKTRNSIIANNIVQQPNGKLADIQVTSGVSLHHNFWVSPVTVLNNASGVGDRTGNVLLATTPGLDPSTYRLSASSPAIGGAVALDVPKDFFSYQRGPSYDMGAIQYQGTVSASPTSTPVPATAAPTNTAAPLPSPTPTVAPVTPTAAAPTGTTTYDDKNSIFVYSGTWEDTVVSGAYSGSFKKSMVPGHNVTMTFTGRSLSIIYTKNTTFTNMIVYVDGTQVGTINEYASSRQLQQTWNLPLTLASGTHILKLVHAGTDTTTRIALDAVTVYP
jgi:parallel beta-helix repeat protein